MRDRKSPSATHQVVSFLLTSMHILREKLRLRRGFRRCQGFGGQVGGQAVTARALNLHAPERSRKAVTVQYNQSEDSVAKNFGERNQKYQRIKALKFQKY